MRIFNFKFKKILFLFAILSAVSLIVFAFLVDWIGLSKPGFCLKQRFLLAAGIFILAIVYLINKRAISKNMISGLIMSIKRSVYERITDFWIAFIVFLQGEMIGTLYVFAVKSRNIELFYAITLGNPFPLHLSMGFINPYGFLLGISGVLVYLIFRLGMSRSLSFVFTVAYLSSPNHLYNLVPSITRDYAKAPFILSVILIIGLIIKLRIDKKLLVFLSILAGMIIGFGYWVREDTAVLILPLIVLLSIFLPKNLFASVKFRILNISLFIAITAFLILVKPVEFVPYGPHRTMGGLMSPINARLGVSNPPYDYGYSFSDEFIWSNSYANEVFSNPGRKYTYSSDEYSQIGLNHIKKISMNFPYDMLVRWYGSVLKILELPFTYVLPPLGITDCFINKIYVFRECFLSLFRGSGLFLAIAGLLIIGVDSFPRGIFCLLFLVYICGYPMLQFQGRHYFYLEFVSFWFLGFLIQRFLNLIRNLLSKKKLFGERSVGLFLLRCVLFSSIILSLIFIPIIIFKNYQSLRIKRIFSDYLHAELEQLPVKEVILPNNNTLLTITDQPMPAVTDFVSASLLVADFCSQKCGYRVLEPVLRYDKTPALGRPDFSHSIILSLGSQNSKLFFPALISKNDFFGLNYFKGLELPKEQVKCLRGLYKVKDPSKLRIILTVLLSDSNNYAEFHQELTSWKRVHEYSIPENLFPELRIKKLGSKISAILPQDIVSQADNIFYLKGGWIIRGYARPPRDPYNFPLLDRGRSEISKALFSDVSIGIVDSDLLRTKKFTLKKGDYFFAEGELFIGGLTVGLIKTDSSSGFVRVTDPGRFIVILEVPEDGQYSLGLANYLDGYTSLENRVRIDVAGWVRSERQI